MDTWLIAQCMARLPRMTYFSHPESSLDDFFAGEESRLLGANRQPTEQGSQYVQLVQGLKKVSTLRRQAPHEARFLRSLRQSLGIRTQAPTAGRAPAVRRQRQILPRYHPPSSFDRRLSTLARTEEHSSQILRAIGDRILSPDTRGIPTSSSVSRFLASHPPVRRGSADMRAPTMSSASHVASCSSTDASETAQLRDTENASNSPSRYQCQWEVVKKRPCGEWIEGGSKEIWIHVRTCHGLKGHYGGRCRCKWGGCLEPLRVSSLHRHLAKHLDIRWRCSKCDTIFARHDCVRKHIRESKECRGAEAVDAPSFVSEQTSEMSTEQGVTGASTSTTSLNW